MESALARQPRDGSAALRVRWARRTALGVTAATVLVALLWLAPLNSFHLLPALPDSGSGAVMSRPAVTVPAGRRITAESGKMTRSLTAKAAANDRAATGPLPNAATKPPIESVTAEPVLLVGRVSDGKAAVALNVEPMPRPLPIPSAAMEPAAARDTAATPSGETSAVMPSAAPPIDGIPEARPPLPLVTDLIAPRSPEPHSAAQPSTAQPTDLLPARKPLATEHRG